LGKRALLLTKMAKALVRNGDTHSILDIVDALKCGEMQCFWNDSAIVVTEIATTPRKEFVNVVLSAGDLDSVLGLHDEIVDWAKSKSYDFARISVRPGFERYLKHKGWKSRQTVMELDLNGQQRIRDERPEDRVTGVAGGYYEV